jgi:hypothetical protein
MHPVSPLHPVGLFIPLAPRPMLSHSRCSHSTVLPLYRLSSAALRDGLDLRNCTLFFRHLRLIFRDWCSHVGARKHTRPSIHRRRGPANNQHHHLRTFRVVRKDCPACVSGARVAKARCGRAVAHRRRRRRERPPPWISAASESRAEANLRVRGSRPFHRVPINRRHSDRRLALSTNRPFMRHERCAAPENVRDGFMWPPAG